MIQRKIIVKNLAISYLQSDSFNPCECLVFLHGWKSEAMVFNSTLKECENFIAINLPGFGGSEAPKNIWGVYEYAEFLHGFFKKLGIENPILIGHSFGGAISIAYSTKYPVRKLVLIGSSGIREGLLRKTILLPLAKAAKFILALPILRKWRDIIRLKVYSQFGWEDYILAGNMTDIFRKVTNQDLQEDMKKVFVPTIIIWGEKDTSTPPDHAHKIEHTIQSSKLFIIPGAGHYVFLDKPKEFEKIFFENVL